MTTPLPAELVIGIDVGTTAVKVAAFGIGTPWRFVAFREYPLLEPAPGHQVQDPIAIGLAVVEALGEVAAAVRGAHVVGISVSTAMHGLVGLDADAHPVTPLLTWADARSTAEAAELRASGVAAELHEITGTPVHPMTPLTKLRWFARHEPATAARVHTWAGLKDLVLHLLTGSLVTELSSASGTALLDRRTRSWSERATSLAGISTAQLPAILSPTAALPLSRELASRVGLPAGTPVVVGAADGPLGNLGTGALEPGVVGLSLGTSGAARMVVTSPPERLDPSLFCYALTEDLWVVGGAVSNGGVVVRWAGNALAPELAGDDAALLALAAQVPPGSEGLVMVPYLLAERAPLWDPEVPGAILGLRRAHTRAHLVRAAVEGVALQLGVVVDRLDAISPVTSVRATGGVFRAPLWREVLAAVLDRPLSTVGAAEGSALGAAALGLFALGRAESLTAALALLDPAASAASEPEPVDPRLVATYADARSRVPLLVASLGAVGELFPSTDPSLSTVHVPSTEVRARGY